MNQRLVSKIKVRKPKGTWLMEFTTHITTKKYFGSSYVMDTDVKEYSVPCDSWEQAMLRSGYVLINLGANK